MIRTQISLSQFDYNLAKKEAQSRGVSLAELFRQGLKSMLPQKSDKTWMKYVGMVQSGNPASSTQIDDIVYGTKD
jgi:hypothetical protein